MTLINMQVSKNTREQIHYGCTEKELGNANNRNITSTEYERKKNSKEVYSTGIVINEAGISSLFTRRL